MRVWVLMLTTAGPYFSTRSAKSGRICAEAPGVLGVAMRAGAAAAGGGAAPCDCARVRLGTWAAMPMTISAPRRVACRVFIVVFRSCCGFCAGARPNTSDGCAGNHFQWKSSEFSASRDVAAELLRRRERHLAQHRNQLLSHGSHEKRGGPVLGRGFRGALRRSVVGLDEHRKARHPVTVDDLRDRRAVAGQRALELVDLLESGRE